MLCNKRERFEFSEQFKIHIFLPFSKFLETYFRFRESDSGFTPKQQSTPLLKTRRTMGNTTLALRHNAHFGGSAFFPHFTAAHCEHCFDSRTWLTKIGGTVQNTAGRLRYNNGTAKVSVLAQRQRR